MSIIAKHNNNKNLEKICNKDPDIRKLEQQLKNAAHLNELKAQMVEKEANEMASMMRDAELLESVELHRQLADELSIEKQEGRRRQLYTYQKQLEEQIRNQEMRRRAVELSEQRDKESVEAVVKMLQDEQERAIQLDKDRREKTKKQVEDDMRERQLRKQKFEQQMKEEERRRLEDAQNLQALQDLRKETIHNQNQLNDQIRDVIANRILIERNSAQQLDELKKELEIRRHWEDERMREKQIKDESMIQKLSLRKQQEEDIEIKRRMRLLEIEEEKSFTQKMMQKLAEDCRLEQLSNEKRRMKQLEHKRAVEAMLAERTLHRSENKEHEREMQQLAQEQSLIEQQIIENQKKKLLQSRRI